MIQRNIPIALADSMAQPASTDCRLAKITPLLPEDPVIALTSLDRDVEYDDGEGLLTYKAKRGYTPFALDATADLAVDNSEMQVLIAEFEMDGFTSDAIERGVYDDASYVEYLVDYLDLSAGRALISSGTIGRIRQVDRMVCFPELRSLTQQMKQLSIIEMGSVSCRATMGDDRCKYPVATLWEDFEVDAVGLETDRVFTMDGTAPANSALRPGLAEWYTGDNAGRTFEIEDNVGAVVTLTMPTDRPIQVGDTGRRRPNCTNLLFGSVVEDGENSCFQFDNLPNYRGEWYRPVSESEQLQAPGAASTGPSTTTGGAGSVAAV